jgi:hypothetical protein
MFRVFVCAYTLLVAIAACIALTVNFTGNGEKSKNPIVPAVKNNLLRRARMGVMRQT